MSFHNWWVLSGLLSLLAVVVLWIVLWIVWKAETHRILMALVMFFPTASTILACAALAYVLRDREVGPGVVLFGSLCAIIGVVLALVVTLEFRRWFFALALCVSTWMLFLFALMMNV
jgi:hypothetical protein